MQYPGNEISPTGVSAPGFINLFGEHGVWGVRHMGETFAFAQNARFDLDTAYGRDAAARSAAFVSANTRLFCLIGPGIDKYAMAAIGDTQVIATRQPGIYGMYLLDPGDGSSHKPYAEMRHGNYTSSRDFNLEQWHAFGYVRRFVRSQLDAAAAQRIGASVEAGSVDDYKPSVVSRDLTEGGYTFLKRALKTALADPFGRVVIDAGGLHIEYVHSHVAGSEQASFMDGVQGVEGNNEESLARFRDVASRYSVAQGLYELGY